MVLGEWEVEGERDGFNWWGRWVKSVGGGGGWVEISGWGGLSWNQWGGDQLTEKTLLFYYYFEYYFDSTNSFFSIPYIEKYKFSKNFIF